MSSMMQEDVHGVQLTHTTVRECDGDPDPVEEWEEDPQ